MKSSGLSKQSKDNTRQKANDALDASKPTPRLVRPRHWRIVVLDDCEEVLELWKTLLRRVQRTWTIQTFTDSNAAWVALQKTPPDLLISDLIHGGIDGFEILKLLAIQKVKYPIIIASGQLPMLEKKARKWAGSDLKASFWPKPFNCDILVEHIKSLLPQDSSNLKIPRRRQNEY
jgi:DNA-binding NtrC family response regulator